MFGFLVGTGIYDDADLNNDLLNEYAAFEWIQRCTAAFGGYPARSLGVLLAQACSS